MSDKPEQNPAEGETAETRPAKPAMELPGRRLREQREASQLSLEEVANHLRLDPHLIRALENDDFSHLPSPAYICGYLRSYARLLKLPEDEIVQAYNQGDFIRADLIPDNVNILPQKQVINPALIKNILLIILVLVVAGGLYWLAEQFGIFNALTGKGRENVKQTSSQLVVPPAPEESTQKPPQADTAAVKPPAEKPETKVTPEAGNKAEETPPANTTPAPKPQQGKTLIEDLPTSKNTILGTDATKADQTAAAKTADAANATKTAGSAPGAAQTTQLRLHFNEDSWAEVTDSAGNRLVYRLVEKNTDLDLDGVPPFTVRLGNAGAVQVFYQGKEIEHAQYGQDQVASFQVGEQ